jgi:hypothetical protein
MRRYAVGVAGFTLNAELARYLRDRPMVQEKGSRTRTPFYYTPRWRVHDRLSDEDTMRRIAAFKAVASKREHGKEEAAEV